MYAAVDGQAARLVAAADQIRRSARAAIAALKESPRGGDDLGRQPAHRRAVGRELGIDRVFAEVLPGQGRPRHQV